jgi:hypothetical protein
VRNLNNAKRHCVCQQRRHHNRLDVGRKLTGCIGFAVYRISEAGQETPLPAFAVFPGMKRKPGQSCLDAPIQKFYWKDVYARLEADKTIRPESESFGIRSCP